MGLTGPSREVVYEPVEQPAQPEPRVDPEPEPVAAPVPEREPEPVGA